MNKLIAILNVIAWAGFWAFGYIALTTEVDKSGQMVIAAILAAIGGALGMWAYLRLVRASEASGYAKRPKFADKSHLEQENGGNA